MIEIKPLTKENAKELEVISRETYFDTFANDNTKENMDAYLDEAYNLEKLERELANPLSEFYFIFSDDVLAGYLKLNYGPAQTEPVDAEGLEIERIYVRKQFKRQGLGNRLFQKALQRADELQKQSIWLGVWEYNQPALAFYKKIGFQRVGQHDFVMGDDVQTDYLMQKQLTSEA
ncbi:GNAT family N-acetyltransferase [Enterococcus sp. HY326]|uniref:GNAT family N-acetyltransferase n=1 Tax=Enterococcus sp. HY326 TaxID=2971265 RepID=UPI002240754F|nr:GNAT family N-acetyltransferase [Enterococcus sp. HY326]